MRTNSASHSGIPHEQHKIATLALTSRRLGWLSYQQSGPPNRCGDGGANAASGGPYHSEASSGGDTSSASGVPFILTATSDLKIAVELSSTSSVSESTKRLCSIAQGSTYSRCERNASSTVATPEIPSRATADPTRVMTPDSGSPTSGLVYRMPSIKIAMPSAAATAKPMRLIVRKSSRPTGVIPIAQNHENGTFIRRRPMAGGCCEG